MLLRSLSLEQYSLLTGNTAYAVITISQKYVPHRQMYISDYNCYDHPMGIFYNCWTIAGLLHIIKILNWILWRFWIAYYEISIIYYSPHMHVTSAKIRLLYYSMLSPVLNM